MSMTSHLSFGLAVALAAMAATAYHHPRWAAGELAELPLWRLVAGDDGAGPRAAAVDARRHDARFHHVRSKQMVVRRVLRGELSLLESAACFRKLNVTHAPALGRNPAKERRVSGSDYCRQVLAWVEAENLARHYPGGADVVQGFRAELRCHEESKNDVLLPPPPEERISAADRLATQDAL